MHAPDHAMDQLETPRRALEPVNALCRAISSETQKNVPGELKEAWVAAVQSKSKAAKNQLFCKWLSAGGDWSK